MDRAQSDSVQANDQVVDGLHSTTQLDSLNSEPDSKGQASSEQVCTQIRTTHFDFTSPVFRVPGARFCLVGVEKDPVFCVDMGEVEASLDIKSIQKEFKIEPGSNDEKLIATVVKGLQYVPDIRPGDSIPSELLDGTASWSINKRHKLIAVQRLKAQLLSWVSGQEVLITDPDELEMYFGQLENKEKIKEAFSKAAKMLGEDPSNHDVVFDRINTLGRELSYIEALRDRFSSVPNIALRIEELRKQSGPDTRALDEIQRVKLLLRKGIDEYNKIFDDVDAQTSEIVGALKAVGRQTDYIRDVRDRLHFLMMSWDPVLKQWENAEGERGLKIRVAISETYRFLAAKFSTARSMMRQ